LTIDDIIEKCSSTVISFIPEQQHLVNVDENLNGRSASNLFSRCGWTPFEGRKVKGRVEQVVIRGKDVYREGQILANPGFGKNIRQA
jgi:carbamoyl-phosphate synthase/aspartate carbamoyltransferase/dihydroorotase